MFESDSDRHNIVCSLCGNGISVEFQSVYLRGYGDYIGAVKYVRCPSCQKPIIYLLLNDPEDENYEEHLVWPTPQNVFQKSVPEEVPSVLKTDYIEARLVLDLSPKASAALSRRVLQTLIRENEGIRNRTLSQEINTLLEENRLPAYISDVIDGIRHYGNFSAHQSEDLVTGDVIDVEPGEAEWLLEIIEDLFDFYYVRPRKSLMRKEALNKKLIAAGYKPMS